MKCSCKTRFADQFRLKSARVKSRKIFGWSPTSIVAHISASAASVRENDSIEKSRLSAHEMSLSLAHRHRTCLMTERVCCGWTNTTRSFVHARQASLTGRRGATAWSRRTGGGGRASRFKRVGSSAAHQSSRHPSGAIISRLLRSTFTSRPLILPYLTSRTCAKSASLVTLSAQRARDVEAECSTRSEVAGGEKSPDQSPRRPPPRSS